jgi:hypothetical protein
LPLNIGPQITSSQPPLGLCRITPTIVGNGPDGRRK